VSTSGRKLSLPIQIDDDRAAVVLRRRPGDLTTQVYLTTTADDRPVISFSVGGLSQHGEHFMVVADRRGRWSKPQRLPTEPRENYRLFADRDGMLTLPGGETWYRSADAGQNWVAHRGLPNYPGGGSAAPDYRHLRETGEVRFQVGAGEAGQRMASVWTVRFTD
jgi:hypothetical protein